MKELNAFREFLNEGKGSTIKLSQSDMDKLHKDKEIEVDDHIIQFGEGADDSYYTMTAAKRLAKKDGHDFDKLPKFARGKGVAHQQKYLDMAKAERANVSENTTMPDIVFFDKIKFNFSDICPSAHKLVKKLADENPEDVDVLEFAVLHRDFFALEKKALGPQGITVDEFNDKVKLLYVNIINAAEKLGVRSEAKEYMDMHIGKIKDAGFKASEPGGSSDYKADNDYYMDETGDPNEFLEEAIEEVRNRLGDAIEGYTDLHKNDVVLESFLGEEELEEDKGGLDNTQGMFDDYFAPVVSNYKTMPAMNIQQALRQADGIDVDELSPKYLASIYRFPEYNETLDPEKINPQEFRLAIGRLRQVSSEDISGRENFDFNSVLPYRKYYTLVRFGKRLFLAHEYGKYHTYLNFGSRLEESLDEAAKPDEKEVNKLAAKLMKDPKFKSRYRGKQGVDFIKHAKASALKSLQGQKKIEEGPVKTFTSSLDKYQSYPHVYVFKVGTMSTDKQGGKFVYNNTYEVKDGLNWNGVLAQVDQLIASPETISVGVDIYYTTGQKEGQLGGQAEVVRWNHDATYKAPKSDYILNARKNQFEDEEAERIIAIRKFMNSSLMGRPPQNVDNQAEKLYPAISRMKDEVKDILANK